MKLFVLCSILICGTSSLSFACDKEIAKVKDLIDENGIAKDELRFLSAAENAIRACHSESENNNTLKRFVEIGISNCIESQTQGQSYMFVGYCYLKVAEAANWILGSK